MDLSTGKTDNPSSLSDLTSGPSLDSASKMTGATDMMRTSQSSKDFFVTGVVILFFLLHPALSRQTWAVASCVGVGPELRMRNDLEELCYGHKHTMMICVIAVPMLIAYVLGIPLTGLALLLKNRDRLDDARLRKKYGFLYKGYKQQYYFWETVIYARKVVVSFIAVFWTYDPKAQCSMCILVCVCALALQLGCQPYDTVLFNRLEAFSLFVAFFTFYTAQGIVDVTVGTQEQHAQGLMSVCYHLTFVLNVCLIGVLIGFGFKIVILNSGTRVARIARERPDSRLGRLHSRLSSRFLKADFGKESGLVLESTRESGLELEKKSSSTQSSLELGSTRNPLFSADKQIG